ncbi:hypothetical protein [Streptococcus cristatus]|uniref:Uncharacterized protein n=1 Tax=Streptococcus cristatus TaxID=45634 RepID=A0A139N520_STRCR|nr:hypothetical protein [Streptococcus cristatus]KXT71136.1 hypothetical protein SCRDD08_00150 [Streptococcus cristatus]
MNDFNYLYGLTPISPIGFSGNPFGVSASLKARKASLEAIKGKLEGYSCIIEDKQLTNTWNGSIGMIGASINGALGSVAGDKYDEERRQEQTDIKTLSTLLDTKRDTMVELLKHEISSLESQISAAVASEWEEYQNNSLLKTPTFKTK